MADANHTPPNVAADLTEIDKLVTLCECTYYSHLRAMSLLEEGKASEHFVSGCAAAHRMARENLRDYIQRTSGVWAKQYDDGTWAACRGDEVITPPTYPTAEAALRAAAGAKEDQAARKMLEQARRSCN